MKKRILVLNGPNLNMLGTREPDIYGKETLQDIEQNCRKKADELGFDIEFYQSNHEGALVDKIQSAVDGYEGVIINAAAYTHTSVAIHDALKLLSMPIIEVHISDPKERESFRHNSYIEPLATQVITGKGAAGYIMALDDLSDFLSKTTP